ncbi:MAG: hypothetical protein AAB839_00275 [Patescibacteria group bacterium]
MQLIPQRTPLQHVVLGQDITLYIEICRSFDYPWLEFVMEARIQAIVSRAFQTRELRLDGRVTSITDDLGDSRVVSVEVPRLDNKGVVTFKFCADRLDTASPRIFFMVTV